MDLDTYKNSINITDIDLEIINIHSTYRQQMVGAWSHTASFQDREKTAMIVFVIEGKYTAFVGTKTYTISKNQILFIPANMSYSSKSISNSFECCSVFFTVEDTIDNFFKNIHILSNMEKIKPLFNSINQEYIKKGFCYKFKMRSYLYDILSNILISSTENSRKSLGYYVIKKAVDYINTHYENENIRVDDLAKMCNVTPTYFGHIFKAVYSVNPKKYILRLKMSKAADLLTHTAHSVSEISEILGYDDPAHFSATFKKEKGISPLNYRR